MQAESLKQLLRRVPRSSSRTACFVLNCVIGLIVPILAVLTGHIFQVLLGSVDQPLTARLPNLSVFVEGYSPLLKISVLLAVILAAVVVVELLLYMTYRLSQTAAVDFEVALFRQFREHSHRLARVRTLSAQETELIDCLNYHLPRVRAVLARFWQAIPRHYVQFLACVICACLIQLQFALLAIIATALLVVTYQFFDRIRRTKLPVVRENAAFHRDGLVNLAIRGPILEAVHDQQDIQRRYDQQLSLYRRDAVRSLTSSAWKTPVVALFLGGLACLLMFVMAVQLLQQTLQLPSAIAFLFCLAAAVFSARRIMQVRRDSRQVTTAIEELNRFLSNVVSKPENEHAVELPRISRSAVLEHVILQDSRGRKLLEDVSVTFEPGTLIGIVSNQPLEARALVEMLLGFGQPSSGRMLIDGHTLTDLKPATLTKAAHWVAADGSLLTGTVLENLAAGGQNVQAAVQQLQIADLLGRLPEGLNTVITSDDDRLKADEAFRLGLARSSFSPASLIVIEEPDVAVEGSVEAKTLQAIQSLVRSDRFTLVLPKRLGTLRHCGKLIFVHQHKVLDVGSHAELIQRNDLYRHLSYMRFNPFGQ